MRVKAGGDQHEFRAEGIESGQDTLGHRGAKLGRARHRPQRDIEYVANASLAYRSCAGIEGRLVRRRVKECVIGLERRLSAIAVMDVEIDDGDPLEPMRLASPERADRDVIEKAKAHRAVGFGMVPRRTYRTESIVRLVRDHRIYCSDHCAGGAQGGQTRGWRQDSVGIDADMTRFGDRAHQALDVRARMNSQKILKRGLERLASLQSIEFRISQRIEHGAEPCR